jgi:hypothetical protein
MSACICIPCLSAVAIYLRWSLLRRLHCGANSISRVGTLEHTRTQPDTQEPGITAFICSVESSLKIVHRSYVLRSFIVTRIGLCRRTSFVREE